MDTGRIFLGIALIACSVALLITPASAAADDNSCMVGCGNILTEPCSSAAGTLPDPDDTAYPVRPAFCCTGTGSLP